MKHALIITFSFFFLIACSKQPGSPEDVFIGYINTLQKAETADELLVYFSADRKKKVTDNEEQLKLAKAFQQISNPVFTTVNKSADKAELEANGDVPSNPEMVSSVIINFIVEDGEWKIDDMKWNIKPRGSKKISISEKETPITKNDAIKTTPIKDQVIKGVIRGEEFQIENAIIDGVFFKLRQGKEFFADRGVNIHLLSKDVENKMLIVKQTSGVRKPFLRLGLKKEGEQLPDEITVDKYEMELSFGEKEELGIPFSIILKVDDEPNTEIEGKYFATYTDIKVEDGMVDLSYDSFDTLRYISQQYLKDKYKNIQIVEDFGVSYIGNKKRNYPYTGFAGFEIFTDPGTKLVVKLQLYKNENGWSVANELKESQIDQAHPVSDYHDDERSHISQQVKIAAALKFESDLKNKSLMPNVRATNVLCTRAKDNMLASCRGIYGYKEGNEIVCKEINYLLKKVEANWSVDKEISATQKIEYQSGKLVDYKPREIGCA